MQNSKDKKPSKTVKSKKTPDKPEGSTPLRPNTWEVFSSCYALENKTQYESYCTAYPKQAKTSKRSTIDINASKLMQNTKILLRIDYLKTSITEKIQEEIAYSRLEHFDRLNGLQLLALKNTGNTGKADINVAVKAEELKGRLLGYYEEKANPSIQIFTDEVIFL